MTSTARHEFEVAVVPLAGEYLYAAAKKLTRSHAEAEDLVQDTLVRAWRFWASFQRGTNIKAWLFTILRNTFINGYHRNGRARAFKLDISDQAAALGPAAALANSMSQPPEADDVVVARITAARIREALELLPRDFRLAVELADLEGLSYREIAELMECPIGTVMSRIYRGRKQLHALLLDHAREIGMVAEQAVGCAR
jgi:RNA polymerase sigma-70 factor (ECF subfamily)